MNPRTVEDWAARRLGYTFRDPALLEAALTHRSAGSENYERLEFLGDSVLNFVVAVLAFQSFPKASEGDLSRYRAALVSSQSLADMATGLQLGDQLRLGGGELKSGGFRRGSILADSLEAVFGAVYLDGGLEAARKVVEQLVVERLANLPAARELKDPKTRLQEDLQSRAIGLPKYAVEDVSGEPHAQWFVASCEVPALQLRERGEGSSRRKAEQEAAQRVLSVMQARGLEQS